MNAVLDPSYSRTVSNYDLLTHEEEIALIRRAQSGDVESRDRLTYANQRLVINEAQKYAGKDPPEDLIQEGNIGLLKAIGKFDPEMINPETGDPYRFSTYATWWVRRAVQRGAHETTGTIHVPEWIVTLVPKWASGAQYLHRELGRDPSASEIANYLGITGCDPNTVQQGVDIIQNQLVSLDEGVGDETLYKFIADRKKRFM